MDDFYNGMVVVAVIDSVTEVRLITDYVGSTQTASVTPDWNTAPDNNDTFTVYLPQGVQIQQANTTHITSTAQTARDIGASVLLSSGTGTGQVTLTSGRVNADITHIAAAAVSTTTAQLGVNAVQVSGSATAADNVEVVYSTDFATAYSTALDMWNVNVENWNTTAVPAEHTAGYPIVTIKDGTGTGEINTNAGAVALVDLVTTTTTATNVTTVNGLAANVITATSIADGAIDAATFAAGAITATVIADGAIDAATFATGAIDAAALAADAGTEIGTAVWASVTRTLTAGTNINGSTFTAIPWNAAWDTEVESEVNDALVVLGLDHLVSASVTGTDITDNSIIARMVSSSATADWDTFVQTTDSLQALRDRGDAAWITATGFSTHSAADVWAVGTRSLTILDEDSTTLDLDTTIRAAVGLGAANLDTQLSTIDTVVDAILADTGTDGVVISAATANAIADALLDRTAGVETSRTVRQALRLVLAALVGKLSGAATTTIAIRDTNDSKDRVTATVDASGNRSAVTLDAT